MITHKFFLFFIFFLFLLVQITFLFSFKFIKQINHTILEIIMKARRSLSKIEEHAKHLNSSTNLLSRITHNLCDINKNVSEFVLSYHSHYFIYIKYN